MNELNITDKNIYIFSHSLSAIEALNQHRISSTIILDCLNRINNVAAINSVSLNWVPGNEEADGLSREGTYNKHKRIYYIVFGILCDISNP